jgi:hypothetical protein
MDGGGAINSSSIVTSSIARGAAQVRDSGERHRRTAAGRSGAFVRTRKAHGPAGVNFRPYLPLAPIQQP